jgi:thiol-disulfide isomerase/thioredoxin
MMMRYLLAPVMIVLMLTSCVRADDDPKKDKPKTAQEQFEAMMGELQTARAEAGKAIRAGKTDEERQKIQEKIQPEFMKKVQDMAPRALELAEKNPKDAAAGEALLFVISVAPKGPQQEKALALLLKNQADRVPDACMMLAQSGNPQAGAFFTSILDQKDSSNKSKAFATLGMATLAKAKLEMVDPNSADAKKFSQEAESLFEQILAKYKEIKEAAEIAEGELFVLKNLSIGKVAPEIEGADSDGKKFKLSDYRGKVVVLDFWALWCGPCMGLVPHEKELVKRLDGKPFAMIGVDFDATKEELKKGEQEHGITWRSFHDGRQGPIGEKWRISSIPAIYVLDPKGVIRYKDVREKKMDEAVDALLKEMGATTKN